MTKLHDPNGDFSTDVSKPPGPVDLRSDTLTRPTPEMLEAMTSAPVGDDVYGEDPSVNKLEQEVASLLGKEAAMFVPSGTMANQIAISLHTNRGDSVLCEADAHCFLYEAGAAAALSGVQFQLIPWSENFSDEAMESFVQPQGLHQASTRLVVIENTHNRAAGRVMPPEEVGRIARKARSLGLAVHMDGARLWNAAQALDCAEGDFVDRIDSVAVCFSKGLGAPVGSALAGTGDFIQRARKQRKRFGGAMRQAGFLAAAASFALEHHRVGLKTDHEHAAALGAMLQECAQTNSGRALEVSLPSPCTNMVYFRYPHGDGASHVNALRESGVLLNHLGGGWLRAVTHLDIDRQALDRATDVLANYSSQGSA